MAEYFMIKLPAGGCSNDREWNRRVDKYIWHKLNEAEFVGLVFIDNLTWVRYVNTAKVYNDLDFKLLKIRQVLNDPTLAEQPEEDIAKALMDAAKKHFAKKDGSPLQNSEIAELIEFSMSSKLSPDLDADAERLKRPLEIYEGRPYKAGVDKNKAGDALVYACPASVSDEDLRYIIAVLLDLGAEYKIGNKKIGFFQGYTDLTNPIDLKEWAADLISSYEEIEVSPDEIEISTL